jgi:hypothetical protein
MTGEGWAWISTTENVGSSRFRTIYSRSLGPVMHVQIYSSSHSAATTPRSLNLPYRKETPPRSPSLASAHHLVYKSLKAPQTISLLCKLLKPHSHQAPCGWASSMPLVIILHHVRWEMEHLRSYREWVLHCTDKWAGSSPAPSSS